MINLAEGSNYCSDQSEVVIVWRPLCLVRPERPSLKNDVHHRILDEKISIYALWEYFGEAHLYDFIRLTNICVDTQEVSKKKRISLIFSAHLANMNMCSSLAFRLTKVRLPPLP